MIVMKAEGRAIEENEGVRMSLGFPDGTAVKEKKKNTHLPVQETREAWIRSLGQEAPWRRNGNPLQSSCLGTPVDREE